MATTITPTSFYVIGGTLQRNAPSYVPRQADQDLYDGLIGGKFCYVLTSRQIASQLVISERTVNTHIGNIYRKLHVNNRVDAVREAMRIRLVEPPR